jgi:hypothetical protein
MSNLMSFRRGISPSFVADFQAGLLVPLLKAAVHQELDLQIREEYINLYYHGCSVIKLSRTKREVGTYKTEIHVKYLTGVTLPDERSRSKEYATFDVSPAFVDAYVLNLPSIMVNARGFKKREGEAEQMLVRNSLLPSSSMILIDRQVQVHDIKDKADVIGITYEAEPRLIIGEVKVGLNNGIQSIPDQLEKYYSNLAGADGRLNQNVDAAYRNVVEQKKALGVLPQNIVYPNERPRVECLAILCDYNEQSRLLGRARELAKNKSFPLWVATPVGPKFRVPEIAKWERLSP